MITLEAILYWLPYCKGLGFPASALPPSAYAGSASPCPWKCATTKRVPNADLYQLLAYATALALPGGLLFYAQGEAQPAAHRRVRHVGKRLEIAALDLFGPIDELLARIGALAQRIRSMRTESRINRAA